MKIIVDAMGGDNAPLEIVKGSAEAAKEYNVDIILVGDESKIKKAASENDIDISGMEIVHANEVIATDEDADSVLKKKPDSSLAVGLKLLADGKGDAIVSAGNSGAICVGGTLIVKRIKGIKRPAFAPILPHVNGGKFMLIDAGANLECRAEMLYQYAVMASAYMEKVMKIDNPRVGLTNVGTEEHKGMELQHNTYELLKNSDLNFVGNVEARDLSEGVCDVCVCDGFTGNMILKTYEGVAKSLFKMVKQLFSKSLKNKIAAGLVIGDLKDMAKTFDYNEVGGAPIMGTAKPVFKAHGSAKAKTFKNAIRLTKDYVEGDVVTEISDAIGKQ
ncbi:MAG: phosphate acyltransferase PlsX [Ruminococcus sp.]|nr:phosphate acyltransferase PlsX [Ruminococcus sp.]